MDQSTRPSQPVASTHGRPPASTCLDAKLDVTAPALPQESREICLLIPAQRRYVNVVRATVEATLEKLSFDSTVSSIVTLAVDEAVTNVIRHGYQQQTGPIWIRLAPLLPPDAGVEIIIEDRCQGVDLAHIQGRELEEYRPGGLGVHIIRGVMDEVEYSHCEQGGGVRLRMVKRHAQPDAGI